MRKKRTTINISLEAKSQLDTSKWQGYVGIVPAVYRGFAFAIGAAQIFLFPTAYQSVIPAILVVSAVGTYSLLKAFYPLRWYFEDSGLSGTGWVGENKEDKMSKTGEKPGKGTYLCTAAVCRRVVILDDDKDTLPPCPICGGTDFTAGETTEEVVCL